MKLPTFKCRCSAIGTIMTGTIGLTEKQAERLAFLQSKEKLTDNQRAEILDLQQKDANKELPKTVKSYCELWLKEQLYGRKHEFSTKYTQKGLINEDESIDMIGRKIGMVGISKNEQFYENEYICGTPDVNLFNVIIDAKTSWSWETFPLFATEIPNDDYYWQGQGYMELTGAERFILAYTLTDTPANIIEREAYYYCKENGYDYDEAILSLFTARMTYGGIPEHLRVRTFEFSREKAEIERVYERVRLCRIYIDKLIENLPKPF